MERPSKRSLTLSILALASIAVVTALCLAAKPATPSDPDPDPGRRWGVSADPVAAEDRPQVDAVFVLDTTSSMSGLIEGAKTKIWSIANQILAGQPRPDLRIGLVGYRDLEDNYVTRTFPLSESMEEVYANLQGFRAEGGGDTPEHVNRALADALFQMQWRPGDKTLRLIFLVGDAPPHEGREGLYSAQLAAKARAEGIVINAVRCGTLPQTEVAWRQIAQGGGGMYASIAQDGGMVAVASPYDANLRALNEELTRTLLPTGSAEARAAVRRRAEINKAMGGFAQAESAKMRASTGKLDHADLLSKLKSGAKLEELDEAELPEPLAKAPKAERQAVVAQVSRKRAKLMREIKKLARERDSYLRSSKRSAGAGDGFDDLVGKALKAQGGKAGIAY